MGCSASTENTSRKNRKGKKGGKRSGGKDHSSTGGDASSLFSSLNSAKPGGNGKNKRVKGSSKKGNSVKGAGGTELTVDDLGGLGDVGAIADDHQAASNNPPRKQRHDTNGLPGDRRSSNNAPDAAPNPLVANARKQQPHQNQPSMTGAFFGGNDDVLLGQRNNNSSIGGPNDEHDQQRGAQQQEGRQHKNEGDNSNNIFGSQSIVSSSHRSSSTAAAISATANSCPGAPTVNLSSNDFDGAGTTTASTFGGVLSIRPSISEDASTSLQKNSSSTQQHNIALGGGIAQQGGGLLDTLLSNPSLADASTSHVARVSNPLGESVSTTLPTSLQPGQQIPAPQAPPVPATSLLQPDANLHLDDHDARRPSESSSYFDEHRKQSTISQVERRRQRLDVPRLIPRGRRMHTKTKVHVRSWIDEAWGWSTAPHATGALFRRGSLNGGVSAGPSESAGTREMGMSHENPNNDSSMKQQPSAFLVDPIAFTAELKAKQQEQDHMSQREDLVAEASLHSNATNKSAPLVVGYYNPGKLVLPLLDPEDVQEQRALEQTIEEHNRNVTGSVSDFGNSEKSDHSTTPSSHLNNSSTPGGGGGGAHATTTQTTTMTATRTNQRTTLKA